MMERLLKAIKALNIIVLHHMHQYERIIKKYSIGDVYRVCKINTKEYCAITDKIYSMAYSSIRNGEKCKVAFVVYSASMWSCDKLFELFENDDRFEPKIVVSRFRNDSDLNRFPTYQKTMQFFETKGYRVCTVDTKSNDCWAEIGAPQIMFYLTPYDSLIPKGLNLDQVPSSVLTVYIPYSYMLSKAEVKYDAPGMSMSWRHFSDSKFYQELLIRHNKLYERNTIYVGYPKMDIFYMDTSIDEATIWKLNSSKGNNVKKIVYAPHHSLENLNTPTSNFSTFDKNYLAILDIAKKYSETTTWIVKPHPNLRKTAVASGLFKSEDEYNNYLNSWNELPNAKVVEESTYYDIFKTSDALIGDSVSFLAEYQFVHRPLLLLTRKEQKFNEFGEIIKSVIYTVPGEDIDGIERFIKETVIDGKDIMKQKRDRFFDEYLDYYSTESNTASSQIFFSIVDEIFTCKEKEQYGGKI